MAEEIDFLLSLLEETELLIKKAQINLKKCPKVRLTKGYIQIRLQTVEECWQTFRSNHRDLIKCTSKKERQNMSYFVEEKYFEVEELYISLQSELSDILTNFTQTFGGEGTGGGTGPSLLQLPKIKLPSFSGNYEDWPEFNDMFTSLVHLNASLSKVQKLHYLKSSVVGEAETLLKNIQVTDSNYEQAWNLLKHRYGNKKLIVNSILKKMFGTKKVSVQSANPIKSLLDTTIECLDSLENLEISISSWDPIIVYLVVQKLDVDTHKNWEENAFESDSDIMPTWKDLRLFLESKYRTLELVSPITTTKEKTTREKSFHVASTTPVKRCSVCNEDHTLSHCKEFSKLEPDERIEVVKSKNLCFNCLSPGHTVIRCRLSMSCRVCNRRHHSLLHTTKNPNTDNNQSHHTQTHEEDEEQTTEEEQVASHFTTEKSTALLATALVPVRNSYGHITVLRALIDQGSQANFISESAAQLLKLKRTPGKGTITGVGSTQAIVKFVVQLELLSKYDDTFTLPLQAYVMPTKLTTHLPSNTIPTPMHAWPHLQGLSLADPSFKQPGRIDMLLGVEVCAQILKGELIKSPPGSPCAQGKLTPTLLK